MSGQNGFNLQRALVFSTEIGVRMDNIPLNESLIIPIEALGQLQLFALGSDPLGNFTSSEPITIQVETDLDIIDIDILNGDIVLFQPLSQRQLAVFGTFSDGVVRNITSDLDTKYSTVIPSIASVTQDGVVTAVSQGTTTLRVNNNGIQDTILVLVTNDAFETIFINCFE